MSILVTGAQGFIGRYLVARLIESGIEVVGVGRSPEYRDRFTHRVTWKGRSVSAPLPERLRRALSGRHYIYIALDLCDAPALTRLLDQYGCSAVIHLAGSLRDAPFADLLRNNIAATHALCEAAAMARTRPRIVFGSSGSVYGSVPHEQLPVRADGFRDLRPIDLYSVTKRSAEDLLLVHECLHDLPIHIGRIFNVVGPGQDERHLCGHLASQFAERRFRPEAEIRIGPLTTTRDFVDVRDVADALILATLHESPPRLFDIATGIETPTRRVFDILAAHAGDDIAAKPSETARRLELGRIYADISPLGAIGFAPAVPLEQSLRECLDYYVHDVAAAEPPAGPPAGRSAGRSTGRSAGRHDA